MVGEVAHEDPRRYDITEVRRPTGEEVGSGMHSQDANSNQTTKRLRPKQLGARMRRKIVLGINVETEPEGESKTLL